VVAIIVIFAGAGLSYGYDYFKNKKNYPTILKGLALALLAALISNWDYLPRSYFSAFRYRVIGQALSEKGQLLLGIKYYEKSIEYEQYSADAHLSLGHLYLGQKNLQKAKDHLLFALALNPGDWKMPLSIAKKLYLQKYYKLALIFFKKAVAINPNLIEAKDYIKTITKYDAPASP
jgi:tetratricopeptide (TPR) repeat protein